jgi:hypothetical protein
MASDKDKVKFHYLKSGDFRVIHADGVFGGITPTGDIFASLFSQRPAIPTLTVQSIKENGELGEEMISERVSKDGVVREMEIGITMRPEVAEALVKWLQERIAEYHQMKDKATKVKA